MGCVYDVCDISVILCRLTITNAMCISVNVCIVDCHCADLVWQACTFFFRFAMRCRFMSIILSHMLTDIDSAPGLMIMVGGPEVK